MDERDRLTDAYARRKQRGADARYALSDPANLYLFQRRERSLLSLLRAHDLLPLAGKRIIDIGCGNGEVLRDFVRFGAAPGLIAGIDLLPERIAAARDRSPPSFDLREADARALPFDAASFDLALQFTLLSSVLDPSARTAIARETMRLLRPGGVVIWYDFLWNPRNPDTRGLRFDELRALYPGCAIDARRVTLAPPLSRRLAPISFTLCRLLETAPFLRSHYLALVPKP